MNKALKTLRQLMHLGVLWVAVCASLFGALAYTKTGLESLIAEQTGAPASPRAIAAAPVAAAAPAQPAATARPQPPFRGQRAL